MGKRYKQQQIGTTTIAQFPSGSVAIEAGELRVDVGNQLDPGNPNFEAGRAYEAVTGACPRNNLGTFICAAALSPDTDGKIVVSCDSGRKNCALRDPEGQTVVLNEVIRSTGISR